MIKDLPLKILASPDNFVSTFYNFQRNNSIETFYYSNYSRAQKRKKKEVEIFSIHLTKLD